MEYKRIDHHWIEHHQGRGFIKTQSVEANLLYDILMELRILRKKNGEHNG